MKIEGKRKREILSFLHARSLFLLKGSECESRKYSMGMFTCDVLILFLSSVSLTFLVYGTFLDSKNYYTCHGTQFLNHWCVFNIFDCGIYMIKCSVNSVWSRGSQQCSKITFWDFGKPPNLQIDGFRNDELGNVWESLEVLNDRHQTNLKVGKSGRGWFLWWF